MLKSRYTTSNEERNRIFQSFKDDIYQSDSSFTSISIVSINSTSTLDELDQSFMYSQLLKEFIFQIKYDNKAKKRFTNFCREIYSNDNIQLNTINEFEDNYELYSSIWWYTKESFIYSMLNKSLRTQDIETIINMGFFIQDLHQHIEQVYIETRSIKKMTIYRGQGLTNSDFKRTLKNKGGLIAFNNFLSTSIDRDVAFIFADSARNNPNLIGILFEIEINPLISSTPFASLDNISYYSIFEKEILFSMHTIFRIGHTKQIEERLWQINLILTTDYDQQLKQLTDYMRKDIEGDNGLYRIGLLMIEIGQFNKALEIFQMLIETISDQDQEKGNILLANIYDQLGNVYKFLKDYSNALSYHIKALEIRQRYFLINYSDLITIYNNIGCIYLSKGDYLSALLYYDKILKIIKEYLSINHSELASIYNNIGMVYDSIGDYSTALSYYKKTLEIKEKYLPSNHPSLSITYNNIGMVYVSMCEYSTALSYYKKTLKIQEKSFPHYHPSLATIYNNIGMIYYSIENYSAALSYYDLALEVQKQSLPSNHLDLATTYNNIGLICQIVGDYSTALLLYEKTLDIQLNSLVLDHPQIAITLNNIGGIHRLTGNYFTALSYYWKTLIIQQKFLLPDHPLLIITYNNIAVVYQLMEDYIVAFSYYEKIFKTQQNIIPTKNFQLAAILDNIASALHCNCLYKQVIEYTEQFVNIANNLIRSKYSSINLI